MRENPFSSEGPRPISPDAAMAMQKTVVADVAMVLKSLFTPEEVEHQPAEKVLRLLIARTLESDISPELQGKLYAVIINEGLKQCAQTEESQLEHLPFFAQRRRHAEMQDDEDNNIYLRNPRLPENEEVEVDRFRKSFLYEEDLQALSLNGEFLTPTATNPRRIISVEKLTEFFTVLLETWPEEK